MSYSLREPDPTALIYLSYADLSKPGLVCKGCRMNQVEMR